MSLPGVDWISLWHTYRPFFFWAYAFLSVLIRLWLARRTQSAIVVVITVELIHPVEVIAKTWRY